MQVPATGFTRVRIGEFEVDLRAGEVCRQNGDTIRLQELPFQILSVLLHRPGEVVTREEIQQKLWPADTFVDFENSTNAAVKKLRRALGDDPKNPQFIETLPRHGYRLIAHVEIIAPVGILEPKDAPSEQEVQIVSPGQVRPAGTPSPKWWLVAGVGGTLATLFAALIGLNVAGLRGRLAEYVGGHSRAPSQAPHIESIAVLPLQNLSHDPEQEYLDRKSTRLNSSHANIS